MSKHKFAIAGLLVAIATLQSTVSEKQSELDAANTDLKSAQDELDVLQKDEVTSSPDLNSPAKSETEEAAKPTDDEEASKGTEGTVAP
jgi:hypothetical protein